MNKKTLKNMLWVFGTFIVLGVSYWFCSVGAVANLSEALAFGDN